MSVTTEARPAPAPPPAPPGGGGTGRTAVLVLGGLLTFAFLGWGILTLVSLTAWQTADGSRTYTRPVERVVVHTAASGVTVTGSYSAMHGPTARASWHSRWSFFRPEVRSTLSADGTLTVTTSCGHGGWLPISCNVAMSLQVPYRVPVEIHSSGGGIHASHLWGTLSADSSGGGIRLDDVTGHVVLDSSGGGIHGALASSHPAPRPLGDAGEFFFPNQALATVVEADSSGGGIGLTFSLPPDRVKLRSSGGAIRVTLPDVPGDYDVRASSSGGGVHVDIPSNSRSQRLIDVSSSGGGVRVTRP